MAATITTPEPASRDGMPAASGGQRPEAQAAFCVLRRLLAEALQAGQVSPAQALACMRALDSAERRSPRGRSAGKRTSPRKPADRAEYERLRRRSLAAWQGRDEG